MFIIYYRPMTRPRASWLIQLRHCKSWPYTAAWAVELEEGVRATCRACNVFGLATCSGLLPSRSTFNLYNCCSGTRTCQGLAREATDLCPPSRQRLPARARLVMPGTTPCRELSTSLCWVHRGAPFWPQPDIVSDKAFRHPAKAVLHRRNTSHVALILRSRRDGVATMC